MSERLDLAGTEKVPKIGTASVYQTAVINHLANQVYSVEILPQLVDTARQRLQQLGYTNVRVSQADGNLNWDQESPYDAIIVTAAALHIPPTLIQQLAEGGRMVLPVERDEQQHLLRLRKRNGQMIEEELGLVRFVPQVGGNS